MIQIILRLNLLRTEIGQVLRALTRKLFREKRLDNLRFFRRLLYKLCSQKTQAEQQNAAHAGGGMENRLF